MDNPMSLENLLLIVLIAYFPFYLYVLLSSASKVKDYSTGKYAVSYLGTLESQRHALYNTATAFYGVLAILLALALRIHLHDSQTTQTLVVSQIIVGVSIVLVTLFTSDLHYVTHQILGAVLFVSSFVMSISILMLNQWPSWPFNWVVITNSIIVVIALAFTLKVIYLIAKKQTKHIRWKLEWAWGVMIAVNFTSLALALLTTKI